MKNIVYSYCAFLLLWILVSQDVKAQSLYSAEAGERIESFTDRTLYASGEKVFFSTVVYPASDSSRDEASRVFYCELITPAGYRITGGKYLLRDGFGEGCLTIPEEALTGVYYLKFYTRAMRNYGTDHYRYIMLKVIHPYKTEVLPASGDTAFIPLTYNACETLREGQSLNINPSKESFFPREEIHIAVNEKQNNRITGKVSISVIPVNTCQVPVFQQPVDTGISANDVYLRESRGVSISGKLIEKESGKPLPGININLSIIGDKDILVVPTDSNGRFFFSLPGHDGKRDIFLSASGLPEVVPSILIDNDFCPKTVKLPSPPFSLNEEEKKAAYQLLVNARVSALFHQDSTNAGATTQNDTVPFYGKPTETLLMDKYIDLPTLREYFTELPVIVKLKNIENKKQFRFYLAQGEMSIYNPLVLVDWVAIDDIEKILAMQPGEIDRIELVSAPYIKGEMVYGGIIGFISKNNDFAGIDLPASGTFINYSFLEACADTIPPGPFPAHIPDARNTLYWDPDIKFNDTGVSEIVFSAPDTPGTYIVLLRETGRNGVTVVGNKRIEVSNR